MIVLVVFCLFKIIMWIVCANLSPALSDAIIHIWFMVNTAASVLESRIFRLSSSVVKITLLHR